jgi:hypothetical protein
VSQDLIEALRKEVSAEEIAFDPQLKYYRDLRNMIDTARAEGFAKGLREA